MPTKIRREQGYQGTYQYRKSPWAPGGITANKDWVVDLGKWQKTTSSGNPWPPRKGDHRNIGGAFYTGSAELSSTGAFVTVNLDATGFTNHKYQGPIFAYSAKGATIGDIPAYIGDAQMIAWGTTGIARALPTNPMANMDTFLGELRDLPQMFRVDSWKQRSKSFRDGFRSGGKDWLNAQFGWLPFVSDIKDFFHAAANSDKIIDQYVRDSGKKIRRRRTIKNDNDIVTSSPTSYYGEPYLDGILYQSSGTLSKTTKTTRKVWFSGAFTYYLPDPRKPGGKAKLAEAYARKLYGLKLDPETLWNLAPWTWAADWVANTGDVIHNWSAFQRDGLVMSYGYVMYSFEEVTTYTLQGVKIYQTSMPGTIVQTLTRKSKARMGASPYGFGLTGSGFTPKQWSIIGALGISKKPRAL